MASTYLERARKVGGILRALAAILEDWEGLDPAGQRWAAECAKRLLEKGVELIHQLKIDFPKLVNNDDMTEFIASTDIIRRLIENVPPPN